MAQKFKNRYRIPSARLQNWDYRWAGAYFITICTQNRVHYFGEIENGKMQLSPVGIIADILWYEMKNHATYIELDAFVVMPNHVHGILILNGDDRDDRDDGDNRDGQDGRGERDGQDERDERGGAVETGHALSLRLPPQPPPQKPEKTIGQKRFQNIGKNSVSSIIGSYKSAVTKHAHRLGFDFKWQPRFYDHIIRDRNSFERIQSYIIDNPDKWEGDKFNNRLKK